jgi:hypothetical protein
MAAIARALRKMLAAGEVLQKKDSQLWELTRDSGGVAEINCAGK